MKKSIITMMLALVAMAGDQNEFLSLNTYEIIFQ